MARWKPLPNTASLFDRGKRLGDRLGIPYPDRNANHCNTCRSRVVARWWDEVFQDWVDQQPEFALDPPPGPGRPRRRGPVRAFSTAPDTVKRRERQERREQQGIDQEWERVSDGDVYWRCNGRLHKLPDAEAEDFRQRAQELGQELKGHLAGVYEWRDGRPYKLTDAEEEDLRRGVKNGTKKKGGI
jgi:hypothetical protein